MLVVLSVLFVVVEQGCASESAEPLYACPYQSWCVPSVYCSSDMIAFHSTTPRNFSVDRNESYKVNNCLIKPFNQVWISSNLYLFKFISSLIIPLIFGWHFIAVPLRRDRGHWRWLVLSGIGCSSWKIHSLPDTLALLGQGKSVSSVLYDQSPLVPYHYMNSLSSRIIHSNLWSSGGRVGRACNTVIQEGNLVVRSILVTCILQIRLNFHS